MAEDLNRKGQTAVIELDETRDQMKIMQQNFSTIESDWKIQLEKYQQKIEDLENVIKEVELKLKNSEGTVKSLESTRYELSVKNADLQQKIVYVQESASKQCEQFNKEIQGEIEVLKKDLDAEKTRCADLQKTLDEYNAESQNKILKARVEERKKAKKLERELNELKNSKTKSEEMLNLQQRVAELEEEKGSLQLKLIEIEDQVAQIENLKEVNSALQKNYDETLSKIEIFENLTKEHESESQNLEAKYAALLTDYNNIQEKFNILSQEHFKTQEDMTALLEEKRSIESSYDELSEKYSILENNYKEMLHNLQQAKDEKVAYELKAIELEEIRDRDEELKKKLTSKITELENVLNDESRPLIQLETENSENKEQLSTLIRDYQELENRWQELSLKYNSLEKIMQEKEADHSNEKEKFIEDIKNFKEKIKELEDTLESKTANLKDLENRKENIEKDILTIFSLFNAKNIEEIASIKNNYETITAEKDNFDNIIQNHAAINMDMQSALDILNSKLKSQESEIIGLKDSISERDNKIDNLSSVLREKEQIIQTHVAYNEDLELNIAQFRHDISNNEILISDLRAFIENKENINTQLSAELESNLSIMEQLQRDIVEKEALLSNHKEEQIVLKEQLIEAKNMLSTEIAKSKDKIKIFLDQISDLEKELTLLREELDTKKETIADVNLQLVEVIEKNKELLEVFKEKDKVIYERNGALREMSVSLESKCSEIENLKLRVTDYECMVESKGNDVTDLFSQLEEKNKIIILKEEQLKEVDKSAKELIEENNSLLKSLEDKTEKLNSKNSEYTEMKLSLEKQNADLVLNLSMAHEELNDLKQSLENLQSLVNEKETLYRNSMEEKSVLVAKISQMADVSNKLEKDFEITSTSLESYKSQNEDLSKQLKLISADLEKHISVKNRSDELLLFQKQRVENITDVNKQLRNSIISLQKSYLIEVSKMGEDILSHVRKAELQNTVLQAENSKLSEQCESLQNSLKVNSSSIDTLKNEISFLQESKTCVEEKNDGYKREIKLLEDEVKMIKEELNISNMKLSGEKSEMEEMLHKILAENKEFSESLSELQFEIKTATDSNSHLKNTIAENKEFISKLKADLQCENENSLKLQNMLSEKELENSTAKDSIESKFVYFEQCKQDYCSLLNLLKNSLQIDIDTAILETKQQNDFSIEDLKQYSKEIFDHSSACLLKNQKNIADLKEELDKLREENSYLINNNVSQKENIANLVSEIRGNMNIFDSKFNSILVSLNEHENNITHINSRVGSFKNTFKTSKDIISNLALSMNNLNNKACTQIKKMYDFVNTEVSAKFDFQEKLIHLHQMSPNEDNDFKTIHAECSSIINEYLVLTDHLNELIIHKNESINKLNQESTMLQETSNALKSKLTDAFAYETSLKKDIELMKCQLEQFSLQQTILSESNNVTLGELEKIKLYENNIQELNEKNSLLNKEIEQLKDLVMSEKATQEKELNRIKFEANELVKVSVKEKEVMITKLLRQIDCLTNECADAKSSYQKLFDELECMSSKLEQEFSEKLKIIDKVSYLEENSTCLKSAINQIKDCFTNENDTFDVTSYVSVLDENDTKALSDLYSCINLGKSYLKDNDSLKSQINTLESEKHKLSTELEALLNDKKPLRSNEGAEELKKDVISTIETPVEQKLESNLIQNEASSTVLESSLDEQNKSLKEELFEYKKKFAKLLSKLKHFKDEKERLNEKLKESENLKSELEEMAAKNLAKTNFLEEKIACQENEKIANMTQMQSLNEQNKLEINALNSAMAEIKERYSILEKNYFKVQRELQEYKQTWEQTNVSYELLIEDSERLKLMVKSLTEQRENSSSQISDLNLQIAELKRENLHLENEAENLRTHANMLLSDNDVFQSCIEKLKISKNSLEKQIMEAKEKHDAELSALEKDYKNKLENVCPDESKLIETESRAEKLENECAILKAQCTDWQLRVETLQLECETYQKNLNLLEKEKTYFQQQLSEKTSELQKVKINLNDALNRTKSDLPLNDEQSESSKASLNQLEEENNQIKVQLNKLIEELNFTKEINTFLQQEYSSKESLFSEKINKLEMQLHQGQSSFTQPVNAVSQASVTHLEGELHQAMNSLHNQGLRCEELSLEVSKLLEERNILQWKVQQYMQLNPGVMIDQDSASDLQTIKVESSVPDKQLAALHESRLLESERTCQELRKANDALDRALISERDQKRRIEEELDLAKEHITEDTRPSDEYRILLGDVTETEMLTETNYLISRNVRTHADKFRRWVKGRRNFLWRTVKSRNYPQLIYLFYIAFIHIWLLSCVFS